MTRLLAICKTPSPVQIYSLHLKVCSTCPKEPNDCFPLETERFVIIWPLLLTLQVRCSSDWARTRMQTPISISHSDCHSLFSNSNFIHGTTRVRASFFFFFFFPFSPAGLQRPVKDRVPALTCWKVRKYKKAAVPSQHPLTFD